VKKPAVPDTKHLVEAFLVHAYRAVAAFGHAKAISVDDLAKSLGVPTEIAEKVAAFLEAQGLVDYDNQAVDVTIPGMIKAEALLRGERDESARPDVKIARARPARRKRT
jgi:Mn-dependent DtxR family transcriptional regulator